MREKLRRLRPRLRELFMCIARPGPTRQRDVGLWLAAELARNGLDVEPTAIAEIVEGISKGGQAGLMLALTIVTAIAEVRGDVDSATDHPTSCRHRDDERPSGGDP